MNAVGIGYLLNLMSFDNTIGWHVVILPLGVAGALALHLLWVRRHGVVPPFPPEGTDFEGDLVADGPTRDDRSSSTHAGAQRLRFGEEEVTR
jgi:ubiquinol-cytochrome c reductase cytochrome b subunit